jgi:hypothetical protein
MSFFSMNQVLEKDWRTERLNNKSNWQTDSITEWQTDWITE